jgi:tetratricopeptide (TPR) repeat protein
MKNRTQHCNNFFKSLLFLLIISTIFTSCLGNKGIKFEIDSGDESSQRLKELSERQNAGVIPQKELPPITGYEYERLGDALLGQKKFYMAYVQYEKSLKLNPDNVRVEYKQGLALLFGANHLDAISHFKKILEKEPTYALAYEGIGRAYFQDKKIESAEANFRKAVELEPRLWKSYTFLGYIYDLQKDHDAAIKSFKSALKIKPDKGLIYNNLGFSYSLSGKYKKAVEAFNNSIKHDFRRGKVYNNLALSLANLGRYDEALEAFKVAGGESSAYNNLGCIYLGRGMFEEAVKCFEKAIELEPGYYAKAGDNLKKAKVLSSRSSKRTN